MIASNFTANQTSRIEKLMLLVPAGLRMVESKDKALVDLLGVPLLGELIFRVVGRASMLEKKERPCDYCGEGKVDGDIYAQAKFAGFFESMRDILVEFPMNEQDHVYKKLARVDIPMYDLFADKDELVKSESIPLYKSLVPNAEVVVMKDSDHAVHVRQWQTVGDKLLQWLAKEHKVVSIPSI